ncbi:MAG: M17 family metallopeptidase, partial [Psychrosphaera sp.]|nr:M17 family metallopeptidase [Psychrosphaera sp.]
MSYPDAVNVSNIQNALTSGQWDSLIVVAPDFDLPQTASLNDFIKNAANVDARIGTQTVLMICDLVPGNRLILRPSGDVNGDYADARNFGDAANAAILMAKQSGSTRPLIWVQGAPDNEMYTFSAEVAYLGATQSLWQPLEARECREENLEPIEKIGIYAGKDIDENWLTALEAGRRVARDLCGTEPERMAPPKFAQYCVETFEDSAVTVTVRDDMDGLETDYPMMMAVARASMAVPRHQPRLVRLEYTGSGKIEKTLMLAGKGLVYDTGGADLKVG